MKIICLTDHTTHSPGESIYKVLKYIRQISEKEVWVVSRGSPENVNFFLNPSNARLAGKKVDARFVFENDEWWETEKTQIEVFSSDVVFLRLDRPVSDEQLLGIRRAFPVQKIINDPHGIILTGSKKFLLKLPDLCPNFKILDSMEAAQAEAASTEIVLKPLHGYGGKGLIRLSDSQIWMENEPTELSQGGLEQLSNQFQKEKRYLSMPYFANVSEGDKRIVIVGNRIVGATLRTPSKDSWLCNLHQGGTASFAEPDAEEIKIAERLIPELTAAGVFIFGFDTLVNDEGKRVLSEINTLNVGGLIQAEEFSNKPVTKLTARLFLEFAGIC